MYPISWNFPRVNSAISILKTCIRDYQSVSLTSIWEIFTTLIFLTKFERSTGFTFGIQSNFGVPVYHNWFHFSVLAFLKAIFTSSENISISSSLLLDVGAYTCMINVYVGCPFNLAHNTLSDIAQNPLKPVQFFLFINNPTPLSDLSSCPKYRKV